MNTHLIGVNLFRAFSVFFFDVLSVFDRLKGVGLS